VAARVFETSRMIELVPVAATLIVRKTARTLVAVPVAVAVRALAVSLISVAVPLVVVVADLLVWRVAVADPDALRFSVRTSLLRATSDAPPVDDVLNDRLTLRIIVGVFVAARLVVLLMARLISDEPPLVAVAFLPTCNARVVLFALEVEYERGSSLKSVLVAVEVRLRVKPVRRGTRTEAVEVRLAILPICLKKDAVPVELVEIDWAVVLVPRGTPKLRLPREPTPMP
jgi:hypothetical protein